jgi:hypothetical protein
VQAVDNGGTAATLDQNNSVSNDQFRVNGGALQTFDASAIFDTVTLTYADGTTATVSAIFFQDTAGNLYLAPPKIPDAIDTAWTAKPIQSMRISPTSTFGNSYSGMAADRQLVGYDDGYIDGTSGNDIINASYIEPLASGSDRIDNNDAGLPGMSGNDDYIRAYGGNDNDSAGAGNDVF